MAIIRKPAAVSIDPELYANSQERAKALGFNSWSAYVAQLIRADLAADGELNIIKEQPAQYGLRTLEQLQEDLDALKDQMGAGPKKKKRNT